MSFLNDKTMELYFSLVNRDGLGIIYIPEDLQTFDLCLAAVTQNGRALKFVREDLQTPEMCLLSVNSYFRSLYFVKILKDHPYIFMSVYEKIGKKAFDYIKDDSMKKELKESLGIE